MEIFKSRLSSDDMVLLVHTSTPVSKVEARQRLATQVRLELEPSPVGSDSISESICASVNKH